MALQEVPDGGGLLWGSGLLHRDSSNADSAHGDRVPSAGGAADSLPEHQVSLPPRHPPDAGQPTGTC